VLKCSNDLGVSSKSESNEMLVGVTMSGRISEPRGVGLENILGLMHRKLKLAL
jgi:hypothetical protein